MAVGAYAVGSKRQPTGITAELVVAVRRELLALAVEEDRQAFEESSGLLYWQNVPLSVEGHRAAAASLRAAADGLVGVTA